MTDVSLPEYVEVCPRCGGTGLTLQTYTSGRDMVSYLAQGPCEICGKHSCWGIPGRGYVYKGTCEPIAPSVFAQIENVRARVPAQGGDVRDRVEFDRGELDEIVSSKGAHLENLSDGRWYLAFQHGDGSETVVQFTSRDLRTPTIEKREPRQGGRAVSVPPLPWSTVATWGPENFGEQLSKWQVEPVTEFEPSARPTRARPANARRKG